MEPLSRLIPVAKIVRTHGVRGALKVHPYGETLAGGAPGFVCYLGERGSHGRTPLTISSLRMQGRHLVIHFDEITGMDEAQAVVGRELLLPEESLPPVEEGEYYHFQLLGLSVVTTEGKGVGTMKNIIETPAHDVYVVEQEAKEVLIPAVEGVVVEVDLVKGVITVDPPRGLIDDL